MTTTLILWGENTDTDIWARRELVGHLTLGDARVGLTYAGHTRTPLALSANPHLSERWCGTSRRSDEV